MLHPIDARAPHSKKNKIALHLQNFVPMDRLQMRHNWYKGHALLRCCRLPEMSLIRAAVLEIKTSVKESLKNYILIIYHNATQGWSLAKTWNAIACDPLDVSQNPRQLGEGSVLHRTILLELKRRVPRTMHDTRFILLKTRSCCICKAVCRWISCLFLVTDAKSMPYSRCDTASTWQFSKPYRLQIIDYWFLLFKWG